MSAPMKYESKNSFFEFQELVPTCDSEILSKDSR